MVTIVSPLALGYHTGYTWKTLSEKTVRDGRQETEKKMVMTNSLLLKMAPIEIDSLPIKNGDFPWL